MTNKYYKNVKTYYDDDAVDFDNRYWQNPVLQKIRQSFREEVKKYPLDHILEIGTGTGLDLVHFGMTHPDSKVYGIDISKEMCRLAEIKRIEHGLENIIIREGVVEDIDQLFPGQKFDMVYVFFGALNTVADLHEAARELTGKLNKNGIMVLSFVNKYYLTGMLIELVKLRFKNAFARLRPVWGGYSPVKYLPSRCYSPREITNAFSELEVLKKRGYCILHPAWYYPNLYRRLGKISNALWKVDQILNKTLLWKFGEYTLFVFQKL